MSYSKLQKLGSPLVHGYNSLFINFDLVTFQRGVSVSGLLPVIVVCLRCDRHFLQLQNILT